jgi:hypothetical protein
LRIAWQQFFRFGFEKMVGDDQRIDRLPRASPPHACDGFICRRLWRVGVVRLLLVGFGPNSINLRHAQGQK